MKQLSILVVAITLATSARAQFKCPPKDGQYEDAIQCDKFYECSDGVAVEKLCPDGFVFDSTIRKINKCDQPFNVDCGDRTQLQPPKPSKLCPRRNGFFAHPEPNVCNIFYNCIEGEPTEVKCTAGLHFDEYSGTCVWPEAAGRKGCNIKETLKLDGFECPKVSQTDHNGKIVVHPKFAHPTDCQRFYVCLNGQEPRDLGCQVGEVYNEEIRRCDAPENVPGCEEWYSSEPAPKPSAKKGILMVEMKLVALKLDGFECPKETQTDYNGQIIVHPKFAHPTDCQRFYVCLNGKEPRDLGCQVGEVYNVETELCDAPENVPGCEEWYSSEPAPKPSAKKP